MESILSQIDETFEVLLINDGSNDRSEDIIDSYAKKYPGIVRVISKKNEGTAKTRNLGIREARGEFIFFIDNDDFVDDGYFKRFINAIDEKSDIVVGGYRRVEDKKVRFQSFPKNSSWYKFTVVAPWAKIYKREFLLKNHIDSNPYYLTMPSSGWVEGYPGVGESAEGGSNQFLYQHARNFDWGMTSAVGIENRRWTVKLQYEMSLGKESKNDNIGVNYNSLTLSVGYKLNVKQ